MQADAPAAALEEAKRADSLDYVGNPSMCERFRLERPWDRHLQPLVAALRSRTQDTAPGAAIDPVDSAVELIQRARETRVRTVRQERLLKAIAALEQAPLVQPVSSVAAEEGAGGPGDADAGEVDAGETEEDRTTRYRAARELTELWGEILKAAWAMHLYDIVLRAAPYVLWPAWTAAVDEEMAMLQVWSSSKDFYSSQSPSTRACCERCVLCDFVYRRLGGARFLSSRVAETGTDPLLIGGFWMQCECMFLEAEAAVVALKNRKAAIVPDVPVPDPLAAASEGVADGADAGEDGEGGTATAGDGSATADTDAVAPAEDAQVSGGAGHPGVRVRTPARTVEELQRTVGVGVVNGMQRAIDCQKPWAVINGAVYFWNAYLMCMQDGWCVPCICACLVKVM